MINTNKLKGIIAENGLSQVKLAKQLGISGTSFYHKMKIGIFKSDEMYKMIEILKINNPSEIFFCQSTNLKS